MQHSDFIIVGSGLAGITLAHTLHQQGFSFKIISEPQMSRCSMVAAGVYNPVVFYRITKSYLADLVLPYAEQFYKSVETVLNKKLLSPLPLARVMASRNEQELWQKRREEGVGEYLGALLTEPMPSINLSISDGLGIVKNTGALDCASYIEASLDYFKTSYIQENFDYQSIVFHETNIAYKNYQARQIIFCEGHQISENPFFKNVILKPVKGEILTLKFTEPLPDEVSNYILNKKCYLLPIGNNIYKVGATYNWRELNEWPTPDGLLELEKNIRDITSIPFTILEHRAGVRPAASDRRPILGIHQQKKQLAVFNGLGTKGVMLAPYFANALTGLLCHSTPIHKEVDVARFG